MYALSWPNRVRREGKGRDAGQKRALLRQAAGQGSRAGQATSEGANDARSFAPAEETAAATNVQVGGSLTHSLTHSLQCSPAPTRGGREGAREGGVAIPSSVRVRSLTHSVIAALKRRCGYFHDLSFFLPARSRVAKHIGKGWRRRHFSCVPKQPLPINELNIDDGHEQKRRRRRRRSKAVGGLRRRLSSECFMQ